MEQRKLTINQTVNMIDRTFREMFYDSEPYKSDTEYYPYRVYPDGTLVAKRPKDNCLYLLNWTITGNVVTFSEKSTWSKVEESYVPAGEIGARNKVPFEKIQSRGTENRFYEGLEARMNEDGNGMEGLGIITNSRTLLFVTPEGRNIYEEIAPEAVANYDFNQDVISAFNHNYEKILGRTAANTLAIVKAADGLRYSIPALPNTSYGNDLKEMLKRGDVRGSSFIFTIADGGETWSEVEGGMLRKITEFKRIYEVGPVVSPAYGDTTAAKRSLENVNSIEIKVPEVKENDLWKYRLRHYKSRNSIRK